MNMYDTRIMLEAVKSLTPARTFLKDTFFPGVRTFHTEHVDVDYYKGRRKLAPFVSPRHSGKTMDRKGFQTKSFKPATIKPQRIITGDDIIKRSMGENVFSAKSPSERAAELLLNDLTELDQAITRREEWMIAQVIFEGKVDIIGEGVNDVMEFEFDNKETLSGSSLWSDSQSDPIAYLKEKRREIIKNSGINPTHVIMSYDVAEVFINHPKVSGQLDNRRIQLGQIDPQELGNGVTYIGDVTGLGLNIYTYDEWYYDEETEEEKSLVPEGTLVIISSNSRSSMLYGAVNLIGEGASNFQTLEGPRIPDSWIKKDPDSRILQLHSRPLPVPHEVDSWAVAKVL